VVQRCESSHSDQIYQSLVDESKAQGVADAVQIVKTGCFGFCEQGPIVKILPEEAFYVHVKPEDAKELISEHIIKGREVKRLLYDKSQSQAHAKVEDIKFYQKQFRIVLRNCGFINPENIDEYIARDGFKALEKALFSMTPDDIINEMKISGLRGRGGAGFPTWMKWNFTKQAPGDVKYVVCNADEGDPGAYMDRSTLEGDPNSVLEAMIICGKAIGAHQGYIYIARVSACHSSSGKWR
jgi:(2Fe-2S) ferredoxin